MDSVDVDRRLERAARLGHRLSSLGSLLPPEPIQTRPFPDLQRSETGDSLSRKRHATAASAPVSRTLPPGLALIQLVEHPGIELHNHFNGVLHGEEVLNLAGIKKTNAADFLQEFWNTRKTVSNTFIVFETLYKKQGLLNEKGDAILEEKLKDTSLCMATALNLVQANSIVPFDIAYLVRDWIFRTKIQGSTKEADLQELEKRGDVRAEAEKLNKEGKTLPKDRRALAFVNDEEEALKAEKDLPKNAVTALKKDQIKSEVTSKIKKGIDLSANIKAIGFDAMTYTPTFPKDKLGPILGPLGLFDHVPQLPEFKSFEIDEREDYFQQPQEYENNWHEALTKLLRGPTLLHVAQAMDTTGQVQDTFKKERLQAFRDQLKIFGNEVVAEVDEREDYYQQPPLDHTRVKDLLLYQNLEGDLKKAEKKKSAKGAIEDIDDLRRNLGTARMAVATIQQLKKDALRYVEFQGSAGLDPKELKDLQAKAKIDLRFLTTLSTKYLGGKEPRKDERGSALAKDIDKKNLIGVDFAGAEAKFDMDKGKKYFKEVYIALAELGKKNKRSYILRPHVGEGYKHRQRESGTHKEEAHSNVGVVIRALEELKGEEKLSKSVVVRAGHATHATIEQLNKLKSLGVIIEANLGSNISTESIDEKERAQVILKFLYSGAQVILNTDAGGMVGTTIQEEYDAAEKIITNFRANKLSFKDGEKEYWFSEIPEDKKQEKDQHTIPEKTQENFDIKRLVEYAKSYYKDVVSKLPGA